MNRRLRGLLFLGVAAGFCAVVLPAVWQLPPFGGAQHPYRDLAVGAATLHHTANVVSAVNFDQRGIDTLGEELILLASVLGAASLLRPSRDERVRAPAQRGVPAGPVQLLGYVVLPLTVVTGLDIVAHGHVTPGGGFQGGVVAATGLHLLYVSGTYQVLERLRPVRVFEATEALGAAAFAGLGIGTAVAGSGFLGNALGWGHFGQLFSGGTVPVLSIATGVEVAGGIVVLLARFLEQAIAVRPRGRGAGR